jgi:hypothetical protein
LLLGMTQRRCSQLISQRRDKRKEETDSWMQEDKAVQPPTRWHHRQLSCNSCLLLLIHSLGQAWHILSFETCAIMNESYDAQLCVSP